MQQSYTIIIAEDDAALAAVLARLILRRYPTATIRTFGNGRAALDAYDHSGADLLFVNYGMPGMDGPTMIRILRAQGDMVPIIGMSGDPGLHDEYRIAGAMAFVSGAALLNHLSSLLRRFLPPTPRSVRHVGQTTSQ